jgi:hypothetical protein
MYNEAVIQPKRPISKDLFEDLPRWKIISTPLKISETCPRAYQVTHRNKSGL